MLSAHEQALQKAVEAQRAANEAVQAALQYKQTAIEEEKNALKQQEAALQQERAKLEAEKVQMMDATAKASDIIELNVGGRPFATSRSTLCLEPDTLLANMFSGRWESNLIKDKNGLIFLNFNPDLFAILLDHLRAKELAPPGTKVALPKGDVVPPHQRVVYRAMLTYLGFVKAPEVSTKTVVAAPAGPLRFAMGGGESEFRIESQGKKAVRTATGQDWHVLCTEGGCVPGESVWKIRECTPAQHLSVSVCVGVARITKNPPGLWSAGVHVFSLDDEFTRGQVVSLSLNNRGVLTLTNHTNGQSHSKMHVKLKHAYRFVFFAQYQHNAIEILE